MKCKACKWFFAENNSCKKFFIVLQKNEVPHNECFERKEPIKNPLRWLKQPHHESVTVCNEYVTSK